MGFSNRHGKSPKVGSYCQKKEQTYKSNVSKRITSWENMNNIPTATIDLQFRFRICCWMISTTNDRFNFLAIKCTNKCWLKPVLSITMTQLSILTPSPGANNIPSCYIKKAKMKSALISDSICWNKWTRSKQFMKAK